MASIISSHKKSLRLQVKRAAGLEGWCCTGEDLRSELIDPFHLAALVASMIMGGAMIEC